MLEDTLKEREQHEGKLLEDALKKQDEQEKLSAMKLRYELEKLRTELNSVMMQKVNICKILFLLCELCVAFH